MILGNRSVTVVRPAPPRFVFDAIRAPRDVHLVPKAGPPGAPGEVAAADIDPILLFENALAGHD